MGAAEMKKIILAAVCFCIGALFVLSLAFGGSETG